MVKINNMVADRLDEVAGLLQDQNANQFRVRAYRHAAETIRLQNEPVDVTIKRKGLEGLQALPGIGESLARSIYQIVKSGRLGMLDRLRGEIEPEKVLASVPGIGPVMAERLHDELGIDSLEELEVAAHDGRLADLPGFGDKRIAGIRDSLATRLGRIRNYAKENLQAQPSIDEIFDVDREYREKGASGALGKIAPRRFNPAHEAWLPVLHTTRGERHYTALFSNTARAHQLGKTQDWVVIYYDGGDRERQCTVITSYKEPLEGYRIIRGREVECAAYYFRKAANNDPQRLSSAADD